MSHFTIDWSELSLQVMFTFAHFLWQACTVAILLLIVERLTSMFSRALSSGRSQALAPNEPAPDGLQPSANLRYSVACLAFFALPVCVVTTFGWIHLSRGPILLATSEPIHSQTNPSLAAGEPKPPAGSSDLAVLQPMATPVAASDMVTEPPETPFAFAPAPSWSERIQSFAPYLLLAYAFGVVLMLARFGLSVLGSWRLRQAIQPITDSVLLKIVFRQSARLGLKRVPIVAICQRVSVPLVVGVVKPAILLPPALLCGLDPIQLAAILSHEMAHIRRYDLLVNLLQRIVEALLFFHPATWWISRRVSIERENCCDDIAAATTGSVPYAHALLQMAELCLANDHKRLTDLASLSAAGSNPTQLGRRIRRLIGSEQSARVGFSLRTFALALAVMLFASVSLVAWGQKQVPSAANNNVWGPESHGLQCRIVPVSPAMDADDINMTKRVERFASPVEITFAVEIKNVSDKPIRLRDVRYGNGYADETKGKPNTNHYGPHLFDFIFTDASGKAIARTRREFVLETHAMILRGALITQIEPNQSLRCILKPAEFERSMEYRLTPGDYQVAVRYRGPSQAVQDWIDANPVSDEADNVWPYQVSSNVSKFSIAADGFHKPDLVWGPQTDGLRAALEIRVPRDNGIPTRAPGVPPASSLHPILHVENVSDKPITFVSETGRQGDVLQIKNAKGRDINVKGSFFTGWPIDVRWTLQPGDVAELNVLTPSLNQGLPPGEYSTKYTIRFNSRQQKDNEGNQIFPAPGDYDSEIDTGWTPLFLCAPDQPVDTVSDSRTQTPKLPVDDANGSKTRTLQFMLIDGETGTPLQGLEGKASIFKQGMPPKLSSCKSDEQGIVDVEVAQGEGAWMAEVPGGWFTSAPSVTVIELDKNGKPKHEQTAVNDEEPALVRLWRGTEVNGRLLWPDKTPAAGVKLTAGVYINDQTWKEKLGMDLRFFTFDHGDWPNWSRTIVTDDAGQFRVTVPPKNSRWWIRIGTSALGFGPQASLGQDEAVAQQLAKCVPLEIQYGGNSRSNVLTLPDNSDAGVEVLRTGDLQLETGVIVRGRVIDTEGNGLSNVYLTTTGPHGPHSGRKAISGEDGKFEFPAMAAGNLTVHPDARLRDGTETLPGTANSREVQAVFVDQSFTISSELETNEITISAVPHTEVVFNWVDRRADKTQPIAYYGAFRVRGHMPDNNDKPSTYWAGETELVERDGKSMLTVKIPTQLLKPELMLVADRRVTASYSDSTGVTSGPGIVQLGDITANIARTIFGDDPPEPEGKLR